MQESTILVLVHTCERLERSRSSVQISEEIQCRLRPKLLVLEFDFLPVVARHDQDDQVLPLIAPQAGDDFIELRK